MRLHVLGRFERLLGGESDFAPHEEVERVVGIDLCGVGVEATAVDFERNVEAQHLLPLRVLPVVLGFVGIPGLGADAVADEAIGGVALQVFLAGNERLLALGAFHHAHREVELRQEIGGTRVATGRSRDVIGAAPDEQRPKFVALVGFVGLDVEIEVPFQPHTVLVVGRHGVVHGRFVERREQSLVEKFACPVAHHPVCPRVAIGIFEHFRREVGPLFPSRGRREGGRGHRRGINGAFLLTRVAVGRIVPRAARVEHSVGPSLVVKIAHREEYLILVGVFQNLVVHESPLLVEEVEAQAPALQASADDADVVRALFAVGGLEMRHGRGTLDFDFRPGAGVVADDGKLFLLPRRVAIDEIAVHLAVAVRVALLEHGQTRGPIVERPVRVGVDHGGRGLDLAQTVHIVVGARVGDGLTLERIVLVVDVDIAENKVVARGEEASDGQEAGGKEEVLFH